MIQNKTIAFILAVLTFVLSSILLTSIIFYLLGYPLSSISEHQLYVFFAILVSAVFASMVYGRGSKERASKVAEILDEALQITIKEKDIWKLLRTIEQLPPYVVEKYVILNINAVEEYENGIKDYKKKLTDDDLLKIRKIIETPTHEIQDLLNELYLETKLEQFKILADPKAEPLIALNIRELNRVLFDNKIIN